MSRSRAFSLLYAAPFLLFVLWFFLPVVAGRETLIIRDVLNLHLPYKWLGAEALREGHLPLIDLLRSGGQPYLGNPNTVALYPDNLLLLVAHPLWVLNAHFWIHLLLAPLAVFYLGRQCGLGRLAAWTAGICYATGGFYLSALNMYNLTAATTLGPAFLGVAIAVVRRRADGRSGAGVLVVCGLLWALLILGGDPMLAAALLVVAIGASWVAADWRAAAPAWLTAPIGIGALLAAPQIVEFLRIAPGSYRGVEGYSVAGATASSWSPANLFEWLVPLAFGKPDLLFWGQTFHAGSVPLLYSLAPGLIALALAVTGARSGWRWNGFAWGLVAVGFFFALGSYNPLAEWLFGLPGMSIFRLPVKLWLLGAVGLALAAGQGMERLLTVERSRRFGRTLLVFLSLALGVALLLWVFAKPAADILGSWMPPYVPPDHPAGEVSRWLRSSLMAAGLCALAWAVERAATSRRRFAGLGLVALQCLGQGIFLAPLLVTDSVGHYLAPSPLLEVVPSDARIVHGDADAFSSMRAGRETYPEPDLAYLERDVFARLFPPAGMLWGLRYEFWISPEGLDSFLTRAMTQALGMVDDPRRLDFLEASGVTHLLLGRELEAVEGGRVRKVAQRRAGTSDVRVYRLLRSAAEVDFFGRVLRSDDPWRTVNLLLDETFDPRQSVVLAGSGPPTLGGSGSVEVVHSSAEEIVIDVEALSPGAVVVQRSYLPIWTATLDGEPAEIVVANMHRMAVEVPAGSHRLELSVERGTLAPSFAVSALALLLLALQVRRWRAAGRSEREPETRAEVVER